MFESRQKGSEGRRERCFSLEVLVPIPMLLFLFGSLLLTTMPPTANQPVVRIHNRKWIITCSRGRARRDAENVLVLQLHNTSVVCVCVLSKTRVFYFLAGSRENVYASTPPQARDTDGVDELFVFILECSSWFAGKINKINFTKTKTLFDVCKLCFVCLLC